MLALVNRQRDALKIVSDLEQATSPDVRAWARALRLRVTGDWRVLAEPAAATPLEKFEYLRAVFHRRSYGEFLDAFDATSPRKDDPEMLRVGLLAIHAVEAGNRWAESGFGLQIDEAQHVWSRFHEGKLSDERLVRDLNDAAPASGIDVTPAGPVVHAIDWGLWAGFLQRHLCARLESVARHYYLSLGIRERGEMFTKQANEHFAPLLLYPIVSQMMAQNTTEYGRAMAAARELFQQHPERVTAPAWRALQKKPDFARQAEPFPSDDVWLRPHVPTGTALELGWRAEAPACERPVGLEQERRWSQSAPYDSWVVWAPLWEGAAKPTMKEARSAMGALLAYDIKAVSLVSDYVPGAVEEHLQLAATMCNLDKDHCDRVAIQLLRDGQETKAADAFEYWVAHARSQVATSQGVDWLVSYREDQGESDRAMQLATDAADVYSGGGLATYGRLLDRRGNHEQAEKVFLQIQARYEDSSQLAAHYLREARRTNDKMLEAQAAPLLTKWFPQGLETASLQTFSAPPADGVVFKTYGRRAERTGLRADDVIVATEGIRVHNTDQSWLPARLGFKAQMQFIVWRRGAYQEVRVVVPQRWFGTTFETYTAPGRK